MREGGELVAPSKIKPLKEVQNKCLRRATGGYKRTPTAALEKETGVPPLDLYIDTVSLQQALAAKNHQVNRDIAIIADEIWNQASRPRGDSVEASRGRRRGGVPPPRPPTGPERLQERAGTREREIAEFEEARSRRLAGAPQARRQAGVPQAQRRQQAGATQCTRRYRVGIALIAKGAKLE